MDAPKRSIIVVVVVVIVVAIIAELIVMILFIYFGNINKQVKSRRNNYFKIACKSSYSHDSKNSTNAKELLP